MKISAGTRIYIAGCGGMLGDALYHDLAARAIVRATDLVATDPWISQADVRDPAALRASVTAFRPNLIINLAAITDLEACERDPGNAWQTNAAGAEHLARLADELEATYVYVSTAGVFDGERDRYTEEDTPRPLSVYGESKLAGEARASAGARQAYVVRAGWMMGGGPRKDKKFINKLYQQLVAARSELHVVDDRAGSPTYTVDFASRLRALLEADRPGLYHLAGEGRCNRFEVACELVALLGLAGRVRVIAVPSSYFSAEYFAVRPPCEALVNGRLAGLRIPPMRPWRQALADYVPVYLDDWRARGRA